MNEIGISIDPLILERISNLESHMAEIHPNFHYLMQPIVNLGGQNFIPRDPTPEEKDPIVRFMESVAIVDRKRRVKYLIFCPKISMAYDWTMKRGIGSLDWIRIQGDEHETEMIQRLYGAKTHKFITVLLGDRQYLSSDQNNFLDWISDDRYINIEETIGD